MEKKKENLIKECMRKMAFKRILHKAGIIWLKKEIIQNFTDNWTETNWLRWDEILKKFDLD